MIKQIGPPATRSSDFVNHSYDYRSNWTPLSPITIIYKNQEYNRLFCFCFFLSLCLAIPNLSGRRLKGRGRGRSFVSPAPKIPCPFPFKRLPRRLCHSFSPLYMCSLSFSLLIFCFFKYRMHAENVPFCLCSFKWLQLSVGSKMCLTTK